MIPSKKYTMQASTLCRWVLVVSAFCLLLAVQAVPPKIVSQAVVQRETIDDDDSPPHFANDDDIGIGDQTVTISAIIVLVFAVSVTLAVISFMMAYPDSTVVTTITAPIIKTYSRSVQYLSRNTFN